MNRWGDKSVDWKGISEVVLYFHDYSRRYGRLGGDVKEKYGTVRFYVQFGYLSLHGLVYPGYVRNQFPAWLWKLDLNVLTPVLQFFFERLFVFWQKKVYGRMYLNALKRYPHLEREILCAADYPEFIEGRTRKEGNELHILGKNGEILSTWVTHQ